MPKTSQPMTAEEMQEIFLEHLRSFVEFWLNCDLRGRGPDETRYRMEGLVFSILAMLDGANAGGIPALNLTPAPHPDDQRYHVDQGTKWWPSGFVFNECQLHDLWRAKTSEPTTHTIRQMIAMARTPAEAATEQPARGLVEQLIFDHVARERAADRAMIKLMADQLEADLEMIAKLRDIAARLLGTSVYPEDETKLVSIDRRILQELVTALEVKP